MRRLLDFHRIAPFLRKIMAQHKISVKPVYLHLPSSKRSKTKINQTLSHEAPAPLLVLQLLFEQDSPLGNSFHPYYC